MWSTTTVDQDQAFDYWRDLICDAFVQLSARTGKDGPFAGAIAHQALDEVELSTVVAARCWFGGRRNSTARSATPSASSRARSASSAAEQRPATRHASRVPRYAENSMTRDGEHMRRLAEAAGRHGIHVLFGLSERAGGRLYMSQASPTPGA